jgi:hypothetical protein
MTTAADLAGRGYLPRELPPPFTSSAFGKLVGTGWRPSQPSASTQCSRHNLFRWGAFRRELAIPNPLSFVRLADDLQRFWPFFTAQFQLSRWSLSKPVVSTFRAVEREHQHRVLMLARARTRTGARYVLRADISRFYHSIYTHTVEWALHTKAAVKANRALPRSAQQRFPGRQVDDHLRAMQGQQSVGVPIGPDTSLVVAETILGRVDQILGGHIGAPGMRYVDDYEFGFASAAAAEAGLAALQEVLAEYELALNPRKTTIRELPDVLEPAWIRKLRRVHLRAKGPGQRYDMVDLFDCAFELIRDGEGEHVLLFLLGVLRHKVCLAPNWSLYQSLLLQSVAVEPGIIREVLAEFDRYAALGYALDLPSIAATLNAIVQRHATLAHGSEVAWAIWAHIHLGLRLDPQATRAIESMVDPVVALLALDASSRGLSAPLTAANWLPLMTAGELHGPQWLLVYEATVKRWLPGVGNVDPVAADPDFAALRGSGVQFYQYFTAPSAVVSTAFGSGDASVAGVSG